MSIERQTTLVATGDPPVIDGIVPVGPVAGGADDTVGVVGVVVTAVVGGTVPATDVTDDASGDAHPVKTTTTVSSAPAQKRRRSLTVGIRVRRPRSGGRVHGRGR